MIKFYTLNVNCKLNSKHLWLTYCRAGIINSVTGVFGNQPLFWYSMNMNVDSYAVFAAAHTAGNSDDKQPWYSQHHAVLGSPIIIF